MANIILMKEQLKQLEYLNKALKNATAELEYVNNHLERIFTECADLPEISSREIKSKIDNARYVQELIRCDEFVNLLKYLSQTIDMYLTPIP